MPESNLKIIPPAWKAGDRWTVAMKTPAPVPADLRPSYAENVFDFRVDTIPDARNLNYRIEATSRDGQTDAAYALYFRRGDFSLERVTRFYPPSEVEKTVLRNGEHPCIYYERRLPVIPDFFIARPAHMDGLREFTVAGYRVLQEVLISKDRARITLERLDKFGALRVNMYWVAGDPWWSRIECTENPPPGAPFPGYVVSSGYLVRNSSVGMG
jgi:hypothetical protein